MAGVGDVTKLSPDTVGGHAALGADVFSFEMVYAARNRVPAVLSKVLSNQSIADASARRMIEQMRISGYTIRERRYPREWDGVVGGKPKRPIVII